MISNHIKPGIIFLAVVLLAGCNETNETNSDECTNNNKQCSAIGVPQVCVNGTWTDISACAPGYVCQNGGCLPICNGPNCQGNTGCTNYSTQCSPTGIPQICLSGMWFDQTPCQPGFVCQSGVCTTPNTACIDYTTKCSQAGIPQICYAGNWIDNAPCAVGQTCINGKCTSLCTGPDCTPCTNNATQCSASGIPQICMAGYWIDQTPCGNGSACQNGVCVTVPCTGPNCKQAECVNNAKQCSQTGIPQVCISEMWIDHTPCSNGYTCQNGECVAIPCTGPNCTQAECTDNAIQCSQAGVPQICISGKWTDQTPCGQNQTCQDGTCKSIQTCTPESCQNAEFYKGNACIANGNNQICGCNKNSDCKTGYTCNTSKHTCEIVCSDQNCAAQTGAYQGNVCITQTEDDITETFCGCNEDKDCRDGYECDTVLNVCTMSCNDAACAAETSDYAGNRCVKHTMDDDSGDYYIACGCTSETDCRDGYTCNKEFYFCVKKGNETGSCKQDACVAAPDETYHGNICVFLDKAYGCGCNSDDDCRGDFVCNYMNQCIIENDISECKTDNDCKTKPNNEYYGNVCMEESYDNGKKTYTFCGCSSNADCKTGYNCNVPQATCVKNGEELDTCLPSYCKTASPYEGDTCVDYYGDILCGCYSNADCKTGYFCDLEYLECTK